MKGCAGVLVGRRALIQPWEYGKFEFRFRQQSIHPSNVDSTRNCKPCLIYVTAHFWKDTCFYRQLDKIAFAAKTSRE
ncbi:hypothetical protein L1987_10464 [Smallanthus sonchifolius]|uniref:Uncharacterized protein n=1 Tax=Smallanthus sonchifolius TaxID=185202 RepID=A0ACB9JSB4_9ASTR|nr:hypothetical protein L1987_10464 [Smallanthus sonchifolius]